LPALAAELIRRQPAAIAATGGMPSAAAAKAATTKIPVVFIVGEDPVKLGLVASLARPHGNLTGINFFSVELAAKRLELLRELVPGAARVAVLVNPAEAAVTETTVRDVQAAARAMGLQIRVVNAGSSREITAAFATLASERPDAIFVGPGSFLVSRRVQLAHLATRHAIPRGLSRADLCRRWRVAQKTKSKQLPIKSRHWLETECLKLGRRTIGEIQSVTIRRLSKCARPIGRSPISCAPDLHRVSAQMVLNFLYAGRVLRRQA
jgi:ABC transporter substrate binding protein